ncbi:MAG: hypothetical protein QOE92_994, partial [Chloroflexota bacterium]|nr:hypothetical protein [Chloroflexota bacterium]
LGGVAAMCLVTAPFSVVLAWLRRTSGSLFAPAVAHATFNALVAPLCLALAASNTLVAAPMGLAMAVPMWALAGYLVATGALDPGRPRRTPGRSAREAVAATI